MGGVGAGAFSPLFFILPFESRAMSLAVEMAVDSTILATSLDAIPTTTLGVFAPNSARIVFISTDRGLVREDTEALLLRHRSVTVSMPSSTASAYPIMKGIGVGIGLAPIATIAIEIADTPLSGLLLRPACEVTISTSLFVNTTRTTLGTTEITGESSSFALPSLSNCVLILEHDGALDLASVEFFRDATIPRDFAVVPLQGAKPLPYTTSMLNTTELKRLGGLYSGSARAHTLALSNRLTTLQMCDLPVGSKSAQRDLFSTSLESMYVNEGSMYAAMLANCNAIFARLSHVERTCLQHQAFTKDAILDMNALTPTGTLDCILSTSVAAGTLLINATPAPAEFFAVQNIRYSFQGVPVEIAGVETTELLITSDQSPLIGASYGAQGVEVGIIRLAPPTTGVDSFELPATMFAGESTESILEDLVAVSENAPVFQALMTPNTGNDVTHATFVADNGGELSCDEAIFLPGEDVTVSVYSSVSGRDVVLTIDGVVQGATLTLAPEKRFEYVSLRLPSTPGLHCLSSRFAALPPSSSNVLFRISERSVVHEPDHPVFYTSGQLEGDTRTQATPEIVLEHRNFDLLTRLAGGASVSVVSPSTSLTIPDVTFGSAMACTTALFCRSATLDLLDPSLQATWSGASWPAPASDRTPWLTCLDTTTGSVVISKPLDFTNVHFYLFPVSDNVVFIHGFHTIALLEGRLLIDRPHQSMQSDVILDGLLARSEWSSIAIMTTSAGSRCFVNDVEITLSTSSSSRADVLATTTTIGTAYPLIIPVDLTPVNVPSTHLHRVREATLKIVASVTLPDTVTLTVGTRQIQWIRVATVGDTTHYSSTDTGSFPATLTSSAFGLTEPLHNIHFDFASAGRLRALCTYNTTLPRTLITHATLNHDSVNNFERQQVGVTATHEEQSIIHTEIYQQVASANGSQQSWLRPSTTVVTFVTPPSLVLLRTSQDTPYLTTQPILLVFNRRIETFATDSSTLFDLTNDDTNITTPIPAQACTLLTSQISIANAALVLAPNTSYSISLAPGRLVAFAGQVPCLGAIVSFSTSST